MRYEAFAATLVWLSGAAAAGDICPGPSTQTVHGTVHRIETMREEPQAELETYFVIRMIAPICGKTEITANTIGRIACSEGEGIEATGEFTPPSPMFDTARLKIPAPVVCWGKP